MSSHDNIPSANRYFAEHCFTDFWEILSFAADIYVLVGGMFANVVLLWLLLKDMKLLSASKVLGVNLAVMDLIYLCIVPANLFYLNGEDEHVYRNRSAPAWKRQNNTTEDPLEQMTVIFYMFNLVGCPLLLTGMCMERYVAVIRPVLYLKLRNREHRVAASAVVWLTTFTFCVAAGLVKDTFIVMLIVFFNLACLFVLMLVCLGGMIRSLQQQSPALQSRSKSLQKRRAVVNVLLVVVPAMLAYLPVLVIVPMITYLFSLDLELDGTLCTIFGLAVLSPRFGVFIGPLFYLSTAKQMCSLRWPGKTLTG